MQPAPRQLVQTRQVPQKSCWKNFPRWFDAGLLRGHSKEFVERAHRALQVINRPRIGMQHRSNHRIGGVANINEMHFSVEDER